PVLSGAHRKPRRRGSAFVLWMRRWRSGPQGEFDIFARAAKPRRERWKILSARCALEPHSTEGERQDSQDVINRARWLCHRFSAERKNALRLKHIPAGRQGLLEESVDDGADFGSKSPWPVLRADGGCRGMIEVAEQARLGVLDDGSMQSGFAVPGCR